MKPFFFFLSLSISLTAFSKTDTVLVEDLRYSWLSMEENEARPIINPEEVKLLSFTLRNITDEMLMICNDKPFDLWIDLKLQKTAISGCITTDLASIKSGSDLINVQIRSESGVDHLSTGLYRLKANPKTQLDFLSLKNRAFVSFYVVLMTLLLFFTAVFRRFFSQRFSRIFLNPFKHRGNSTEDYYSHFFDLANLVAVAYTSLLISFCMQYFQYKANIGLTESFSTWDFLWQSLITTVGIIMFFIFKQLLGAIISHIFGFRSINNFHNQDFINFFTWVFYLILFLTLVDYSLAYHAVFISDKIPSVIIAVAIIIFQCGIYLKLERYIPHNKIMIFSYLCATEFIPGFILIYLLLK